jgi:site-specific recombinase
MEALLEQFGETTRDELQHWVALVAGLRPDRAADAGQTTRHLRELCDVLARRADLRVMLRASLTRLFRERKQVSLYVSSGLLPSTGFFSETARRISGRLLPEVIDTGYMKDLLSVVFTRSDDEIWVNAISDEQWIRLLGILFDEEAIAPTAQVDELPTAVAEIVEALRVLSYHVSAIGLDPELVRVDPTLEEHESPFLAQNAELVAYLTHYRSWWHDRTTTVEDGKHLKVMLDQCEDVVLRLRRRAAKIGTSLSLTFKLERLRQHLKRMAHLLDMLDKLHGDCTVAAIAPNAVQLFKELVHAECRKNKLSDYWGQNVELLSLRMTESASRTGERYITSSRSEYFGILGSAALGGLIIAVMAAFKLILARQGLPPLTGALAFCLNYGIGFVLIHVLGGTVATKQPAMTANAIAASIGEAKGKNRNLDNLVELIVRTVRSQLAAILGNVGVAIPVAILLALAIQAASGEHFVTPAKAHELLGEVDPASGAVLFAAIAGVCLFLSGLIAGYYDNLSAYGRIPQRLLQLRWPRRLLGEARMHRVAAYIEDNLGALAGNFFFGFLLGGVTALGALFGLPLDIRHIAFSSAYIGYAAVGLDFALPAQLSVITAAGIVLIGVTNLAVSFALTLYVALRARRITFAQGRELVGMIFRRFISRPLDFVLPPTTRRETAPRSTEPPSPTSSTDRPTAAEREKTRDTLGQSRPNG